MAGGGRSLQAALTVVAVDSALYWFALLVRPGDDIAALDPSTVAVFVVAGLVGTAAGRLFVFTGVDRVGASVSNATVSARPLFATVLAVAWLGEPVDTPTAVGIGVLVSGLVVLSLSRGGDTEGWRRRDLLFPLGAASAFAVGNVLRRYGLVRAEADPLTAVAVNETAALVALLAYVVAAKRSSLNAPLRTYGFFAASGVLTAVALLSFFAAFAHPAGHVALVDPLEATAPLLTLGFAALLLSDVERVTRGVVAGAGLIVLGAVLVGL